MYNHAKKAKIKQEYRRAKRACREASKQISSTKHGATHICCVSKKTTEKHSALFHDQFGNGKMETELSADQGSGVNFISNAFLKATINEYLRIEVGGVNPQHICKGRKS